MTLHAKILPGTTVDSPEQWVPVIAKQRLENKAGRPVETTFSYLAGLRDELRRYYGDLKSLGIDYKRPVIIEHETLEFAEDMTPPNPNTPEEDRPKSRRTGDILDAEIRKFSHTTLTPDAPDARWTLFLKIGWRPSAFEAIQAKELQHVSIHTLPRYTDPQTQKTYAPFIWELSETSKPMVKDFHLGMTLDENVLKAVGLRLAEDTKNEGKKMDEETMLALVEGALEAAIAPMVERLSTLEAQVQALMAEDVDEEGDGVDAADDPTPAVDETPVFAPVPVAPVPVASAPAPEGIAASDFNKLSDEVARMRAAMEALGKRRTTAVPGAALNTTGIQASSKLSEEDAWDKAEKELPGASYAAIAKRAKKYC